MSITWKPFGVTPAGESVTEYTLTNHNGASVSICDFGAIVTRILVPDRNGALGDVNLGFDSVDVYASGNSGSMGALIGRVGNRIGRAAFELEGARYVLGKNNGENNLHGGPEGFNMRMWKAQPSCEGGVSSLTLSLVSPDMDQGFPGELSVTVTYSFNDQNELAIVYHALTSKTTLVNLTNHAYFNLDGHDAGTVEDLQLQIFADEVTEIADDLIPTGRTLSSASVPYGFETAARVGDVLAQIPNVPIMKAVGGVDFNYCAGADRQTKRIATLYSPKTGRVMDVITDQPGVQCYTGQGLNHTGKGGALYGRFAGICLETQHYPDAIHHPHFPSIVLRPQDRYYTFTVYRFGVR